MNLREYPIRFGFKMVDLYDSLTTSARGRAILPTEVPNAMTSFENMPDSETDVYGAFRFADLMEVFNYLRRNKHLEIPKEWRHLIPKPT